MDKFFEIPICWISKPVPETQIFDSQHSTQPPFIIDKSRGDVPYEIVLNPYSITNAAYCGPVFYSATTKHSKLPEKESDLFKRGLATVFGSKLVFENSNFYTPGKMTVTVEVAYDFAKEEAAYTFDFDVRIIDCNIEQDYLEFAHMSSPVCKRNMPPQVLNQMKEVLVKPLERVDVDVGFAFDEEGDPMSLTEWGFEDLPAGKANPTWIKHLETPIEDGIIFQVSPSTKEIREVV